MESAASGISTHTLSLRRKLFDSDMCQRLAIEIPRNAAVLNAPLHCRETITRGRFVGPMAPPV